MRRPPGSPLAFPNAVISGVGQVSPTAHYGLAQLIFYKYDKNHNGSIDKKELAAALKDAKCSAEDSAAVMAEFGGGKIGLPEFKQLIAKCSALQAARSSFIFTMFAAADL